IETYADVFGHDLSSEKQTADGSQTLSELLTQIGDELSGLEGNALRERGDAMVRSLWTLYTSNSSVKELIDEKITLFNGTPNDPKSFDLLDDLLLKQYYRICHWKVSSEELNYRRFFTVNELISVKVENPAVFEQTHALIKTLVEERKFNGLRIDHIDGLYDPLAYLTVQKAQMVDVYTIVEKILEADEKLPTNWPIQGTSGYEFLTCVNQLFCASENEEKFTEIYRDFIGDEPDYAELVLQKKQLLAETNFIGDIDNLTRQLKQIAMQHRRSRDLTAPRLRRALQTVMVCFPIYCTYIDSSGVSERDAKYVKEAVEKARSRVDDLDQELNFIERIFLLDYGDGIEEAEKSHWLHFVMKVQQFTGPLMAKGLEDTLFYIYNRFIGLNEVGGSPDEFGISIAQFHQHHQYKHQHWPHMLNTTSTHDTKRSEDVRARLNILSELPDLWREQVKAWRELNADKVKYDSGQKALDPNDEYFLYQTLVGAYPFDKQELPDFKERVQAYVVKAVREAKVNSDWCKTDEAYEAAYTGLVDTLLTPAADNDFLEQLKALYQKIAPYGIYNSLSQLLIKLTVPGAADIYQGTELWDLSLVDPDNRRPVDYEKRIELLNAIKSGWETDSALLLSDLLASKENGSIKMFLLMRVLNARHRFKAVFESGSYEPLETVGTHAKHVVAYARRHGNTTVVVGVPRFLTGLVEATALPCGEAVWKDTAIQLPDGVSGTWTNWLDDSSFKEENRILLTEAFLHFPVALLVNENDS
ncbi:MAG: malto-oligosyltrehalose synthase, partial [Cyanobacteria bacterium J06649_4]